MATPTRQTPPIAHVTPAQSTRQAPSHGSCTVTGQRQLTLHQCFSAAHPAWMCSASSG